VHQSIRRPAKRLRRASIGPVKGAAALPKSEHPHPREGAVIASLAVRVTQRRRRTEFRPLRLLHPSHGSAVQDLHASYAARSRSLPSPWSASRRSVVPRRAMSSTSRSCSGRQLQRGGRWYGVWWQAVPSALRAGLRINGEPTIELDYAACQLRLMFAHLGLLDPLHGQIRATDPALDLYSIEGVARNAVKLALLIVINASSPQSARRALAARLTTIPTKCRAKEAARILGAVQRHFSVLEPLWCSGVGLRLQRADSDVCGRIQRDMRAEGLPVLSIHDSFICWERAEAQLRAIMQKAFMQVWNIGIQHETLDC
jgi:hypothetical protein